MSTATEVQMMMSQARLRMERLRWALEKEVCIPTIRDLRIEMDAYFYKQEITAMADAACDELGITWRIT